MQFNEALQEKNVKVREAEKSRERAADATRAALAAARALIRNTKKTQDLPPPTEAERQSAQALGRVAAEERKIAKEHAAAAAASHRVAMFLAKDMEPKAPLTIDTMVRPKSPPPRSNPSDE